MKRLLVLLLLAAFPAVAQITNPQSRAFVPFCSADPPVGACGSSANRGELCIDDTNDTVYVCQSSSWVSVGGGGGGGDADTLDGLDSLAFLKADGTVTGTGTQTFSNAAPLDLSDSDPVVDFGDGSFAEQTLTFEGHSTQTSPSYPVVMKLTNAGDASGTSSLSWRVTNTQNSAISSGPLSWSSTGVMDWTSTSGMTFTSGAGQPAINFNNTEVDADFRVKGFGTTDLLYTDASTNRVGIGTATPSTRLDVNGTATATSFSGPVACTDCIALTTETTGNYVSSATASQGLTLTGTEGASLGLQDCAANEILKRNAGDTAWECAADGGGGGNSFETWDAPAGTDPVADSSTDTMTLAATAPLSITGDSTTDTLTFAVDDPIADNVGFTFGGSSDVDLEWDTNDDGADGISLEPGAVYDDFYFKVGGTNVQGVSPSVRFYFNTNDRDGEFWWEGLSTADYFRFNDAVYVTSGIGIGATPLTSIRRLNINFVQAATADFAGIYSATQNTQTSTTSDWKGIAAQTIASLGSGPTTHGSAWGGDYTARYQAGSSLTFTNGTLLGAQFRTDVTGSPNLVTYPTFTSLQSVVSLSGATNFTLTEANAYRISGFTSVGSGNSITTGYGVRLDDPSGTIGTFYGISIGDITAATLTEGDAIRVVAQATNSDPGHGNLNLEGGDFDDGHVQLGAGHLWNDSGTLRFNAAEPTTATDGTPLNKCVQLFMSNHDPGNGTDNFAPLMGTEGSATLNEAEHEMIFPYAYKLHTLYVEVDVAPDNGGGTQAHIITLRKNGGDETALQCTISEAATTCNDTTGSVSFVATDTGAWEVSRTGTPVDPADMMISVCGEPE